MEKIYILSFLPLDFVLMCVVSFFQRSEIANLDESAWLQINL